MIKKASATNGIPKKYWGVWQRQLLETATSKDDTSLVLWMQTQQYHIDIRIPAACANIRKVSSLEDYTHEELLLLASQQGFAGITQVIPSTTKSSDICQWQREIDYQPQTVARDVGKMVFTDVNTMIETGLDDVYLEVWRRLEQSQELNFFEATTGKNRQGLKTPAYLMRAGNFVAYARPRTAPLPKSTSLLDAIAACKPQREQLLDWLDMEISFGEVIDDKYWKIQHSTLPFKGSLIIYF